MSREGEAVAAMNPFSSTCSSSTTDELITAAKNGCIESLKSLHNLYREGSISRDDYNDCVNAYRESATSIAGVVHEEPETISPFEVDFTSEETEQYVTQLQEIIVWDTKCDNIKKEDVIDLLQLFQSTMDPAGKAETPLAEASFVAVEERLKTLIRDKEREDMLRWKGIYEKTIRQLANEVAFHFSLATVFHPYRTDGRTIESESIIFLSFYC